MRPVSSSTGQRCREEVLSHSKKDRKGEKCLRDLMRKGVHATGLAAPAVSVKGLDVRALRYGTSETSVKAFWSLLALPHPTPSSEVGVSCPLNSAFLFPSAPHAQPGYRRVRSESRGFLQAA